MSDNGRDEMGDARHDANGGDHYVTPNGMAMSVSERFAYVALFKERTNWLPNVYDTCNLIARGHVEERNGYVRLTDAGRDFWMSEVVRWRAHCTKRGFGKKQSDLPKQRQLL